MADEATPNGQDIQLAVMLGAQLHKLVNVATCKTEFALLLRTVSDPTDYEHNLNLVGAVPCMGLIQRCSKPAAIGVQQLRCPKDTMPPHTIPRHTMPHYIMACPAMP